VSSTPKRVRTPRATTSRVKSAKTAPENGTQIPVEDMIRVRAYQLWEQRGRQDGSAEQDWLLAEAEVRGRSA